MSWLLPNKSAEQGASVGAGLWSRAEVEAALGQPQMVDDPVLTVHQAATLLGIDADGVRRLTRSGLIRRRGAGPRWQYRLSDLAPARAKLAGNPLLAQPRPSSRAPADHYALGDRGFAVTAETVDEADLVTLEEAAAIVGVPFSTLRNRFVGTVDLPRVTGTAHQFLRRSDAERLAIAFADRLTIDEAAQRLGVSTDEVRRLLRERVLPWYGVGPTRPIRADHVEKLPRTGWVPPPPDAARDPVHVGRVPAAEAAAIVGVSTRTVLWWAQTGRIPAVKDRQGRWWAKPEHMHMTRRAREAQRSKKPR